MTPDLRPGKWRLSLTGNQKWVLRRVVSMDLGGREVGSDRSLGQGRPRADVHPLGLATWGALGKSVWGSVKAGIIGDEGRMSVKGDCKKLCFKRKIVKDDSRGIWDWEILCYFLICEWLEHISIKMYVIWHSPFSICYCRTFCNYRECSLSFDGFY